MPDVFSTIAGLLNVQANTNLMNQEAAGQQVLAQERAILVQRQQQQLQDEATTQQIMQRMAAGQQGPQMRGGEVVEGDAYVSDLSKELAREQQNANQLRQIAQAMQGSNVSLETQRKWQAEADSAQRAVVATEREYRQAQSDLMKHVGSVAGSARDDDSFRNAYQQIAQMNPMLARSLNVDRDPNGIPFYGPKSQAAMESLALQGMTANEQIARKIQIDAEARKAADETRKIADDKARMDEVAAHTALYRAQATAVDRKNKEDKKSDVAKTAEKEPTREMVQDTKYAVEAFVSEKYPGMKKDNTMNAFAVDVASHANTLRAEAEARGEKLSIEDARRKAMESLMPRLHTTDTVSHWYKSDEPGVVSYRHTIATPAAPKKEATPDQPKTADEYLRSIGVQ